MPETHLGVKFRERLERERDREREREKKLGKGKVARRKIGF